eukprot:7378905-Prymnesium_polylepis.1
MHAESERMHAQPELDSHGHGVHQPHKRSRRPATLSTAAQCCCRGVLCTLHTSVTHFERTSLTREASAQPPSAPQLNAAIAARSAMHAPHERDSPKCTCLAREAGAQPPSALQPNAAIAKCHPRST